jgi:hypothetical protein
VFVKNIGSGDRIARFISGIVFLVLAYFVRSNGWLLIPALALSGVGFLQAAVGM